MGPFRLTKALLGALAASAREGGRPLVVNVSSDAAVTPYAGWGAYGASKAALHHLSRIWNEELASEGIRIISVDPGDMDTPLHALAVPDADRSTLKSPEAAAREIADLIAAAVPGGAPFAARESGGRSMIPASTATQRPADARLLVIDEEGAITHRARADFVTLVRPGDVVVANDAATLPASLTGIHVPTGGIVEVRLAGRDSLLPRDVTRFTAVVFGAGDFRTPTEHRPLPPALHPGDELRLGSLRAIVLAVLAHPRLIEVRFENPVADIWEALARHGRPIQYAYIPEPLAIWDTWTRIASLPVAFEAPSAGFILDWSLIGALRARGAAFATADARCRYLLDGRRRTRSTAAARRAVRHSDVNRGIDRRVQGSRWQGDRHRHDGRARAGTRGACRRNRSSWRWDRDTAHRSAHATQVR